MKQPTSEECTNRTLVFEDGFRRRFAFWHPQWGGYVGKAIVEIDKCSSGCFVVHNWHDGDFPRDDVIDRKHYCDPEQLIEMGTFIKGLINDAT